MNEFNSFKCSIWRLSSLSSSSGDSTKEFVSRASASSSTPSYETRGSMGGPGTVGSGVGSSGTVAGISSTGASVSWTAGSIFISGLSSDLVSASLTGSLTSGSLVSDSLASDSFASGSLDSVSFASLVSVSLDASWSDFFAASAIFSLSFSIAASLALRILGKFLECYRQVRDIPKIYPRLRPMEQFHTFLQYLLTLA